MTTFANCVSIFLIAIGAIAVIAGITNAAESGANSALTGVTAMFSGLLLIAAALGLRLLAIIAREPERREQFLRQERSKAAAR